MVKYREINGTEEIGLITPIPTQFRQTAVECIDNSFITQLLMQLLSCVPIWDNLLIKWAQGCLKQRNWLGIMMIMDPDAQKCILQYALN